MIRNIIFDMGGVIITINHQQAVVRFKALGLKDADRQLTLTNSKASSVIWKVERSIQLNFNPN